jgi:Cu/Ag efflux protein CusF
VNAATAVLAALIFFGAGPGTVPQEQDNQSQPVDQVEVTKATGTVQKVDTQRRKLVVRLDDGRTKTYRIDKSVKNLDQFHTGDRVQVSSTEEIVMMADKSSDGSAAVARYGTVAVTPEGEAPAIVKVDTAEITGRIVAVDPQKRRITFEDPQGKKRTLKLSKKINNLDQFKPGDTLNMAVTDETAIELVK